ncbi:MAG: L-threonine 3-dehydrogenase [Deltaproteobacteria bacterium]|nr:L-threonine 3-dehydrogenase [Deltaproteobacteria bacterium]
MRALVKSKRQEGLWMEDVQKPTIGPNDLLIKIKKTGICGSDVHIFNWDEWSQKNLPVPLVIGHEFCGAVEQMGSAVRGFRIGDRVSGEGHVTCGHCRNCRAGRRHLCRNTLGIGIHISGCFAEYLSLPAENAFHVPDGIADDVAAIFDPLGNAVHTALSFDLVGEDVLITGAGPIGIMAAAVCRHVGARHVIITDINPYRRELARKVNPTFVMDPTHENFDAVMQSLNIVEGFDIGLEMSGNVQALQSMLKVMNNGGRVALLGIFSEPVTIDYTQVIFKGLHIKGIYGREMYETWYKMKTLLQSGLNIAPVITHHLPVSQFIEGFEIMRTGKSGKVVLEW